ncbi:substrate-binding domain-containing protein [Erwiniaceae bacterium CMYE1]|nr:substrate-binding domain-containing protein [Erwinia phyllosphaerae]MBV4368923.1 substrate-binding domain-containing protein [Erwinia phyllosphaerae]
MMTLRVLAAGSLRAVWPDLAAAYRASTGNTVTSTFGPAGLLRQRIMHGEHCDLFLSANIMHPQALLASGRAMDISVFCHNQLCLSVREELAAADRNWLELLCDPALRIATSTPISDPSGDYTWQLFDLIEQYRPTMGAALKQRALQLVGGPQSLPVPAGEVAAGWLLNNNRADIFIGYQSYAARINPLPGITVMAIPAPFKIRASYGLAICQPAARPLAEFLLSAQAQEILQKKGFLPLAGKEDCSP